MPSHVDPAIYVAANIGDRRVVAKAMAALRIGQARAVGHLVMFWGRVAMTVPDGKLAGFTDAQLESWAGWEGKRGAWAAWLRAEHLDPEQKPTDWDEYAGRLAAARQRAREKKEKQRNELRDSVPGTSEGQDRGQSRPSPEDSLRARARTLAKGEGEGERSTTLPAASAREDVGQSLTAAQRLVIAANQAITRRWGEQTRPMLPGHGPTVQLVADLTQASVPIDFACASIARQVEGKGDGPPRSMGYFRPGILEDWQAAETRALAAGTPEVAPLTAGRKATNRHTLDPYLAGAEMVTAAIKEAS